MALRESGAKYSYGLSRTRLRALNDDLTRAEYNNVIGGAGPFDYSSLTATITSIPINFKVNGGAVVAETFDLTAAVDKAAVTVDELVTALTAASITGWTFSKDSTTGRIKMVNSTTGAYVQVYGDGARLCRIGQGKGLKLALLHIGRRRRKERCKLRVTPHHAKKKESMYVVSDQLRRQ